MENTNNKPTDSAAADNSSSQDPSNVQPFNLQPTGLVETTLAETLGLSMHNAVVNQQSSHMTTAASITNACARLLQAPAVRPKKDDKGEDGPIVATKDDAVESDVEEKPPGQETKKKMNLMNFFSRKKKSDAEAEPAEPAEEVASGEKKDE